MLYLCFENISGAMQKSSLRVRSSDHFSVSVQFLAFFSDGYFGIIFSGFCQLCMFLFRFKEEIVTSVGHCGWTNGPVGP